MQPVFPVVVFMALMPLSAAGQTLSRVRIQVEDAPAVAEQLRSDGFDVLEGSVSPGSLELVVNGAESDVLVVRGYGLEIVEIGRPFREIQAEKTTALAVPAGYPDLAQVLTAMNAAEAAFPAICQVVDLTSRYGTPATADGRHMFALKVSDNVALEEDEPAFLLVSNHHAREIVTPLIAMHAFEELTAQYGVDSTITDLVNEYEIWIAPIWNPDGYEYVFNTDNLWRKNRRVFTEGVGVDLNRNYPFGWDSPCGGSDSAATETFRGPSPSSEAETQTMVAWAQDRRFAKVVDFHSYGLQVRYGLACLNYPFLSFLIDEAVDIASAVPGYGIGPSCCTGGDFGYHLASKASHAFLWETATAFQPAFSTGESEAAAVFSGVMAHLQRAIPLSGHVTDVVTGGPVVANISYDGITFENGESNGSGADFGRYHVFLPAGDYDVTLSAAGYVSQTHAVSITADSAQLLDVALSPVSVPAVTAWGIVAMTLLLLVSATVLQRRPLRDP